MQILGSLPFFPFFTTCFTTCLTTFFYDSAAPREAAEGCRQHAAPRARGAAQRLADVHRAEGGAAGRDVDGSAEVEVNLDVFLGG